MANKTFFEDEINFLDVIKNPVRWFGIIYPYFLVIIIAGGIYYYNSMSRTYKNSVPPAIVDSANIFTDVRPVKGSISAGIDINTVANASKELFNQGENLYKANCVSCHGEKGMGDGPAGQVMNPKPRNFHANDSWVNGKEFSAMFTTVTEGIIKTGMPSYSHLTAQDRIALVHFVRTFDIFPEITDQELTQLDQKYNLKEGSVTHSQISVSAAVEKISEESLPEVRKVYAIISYINNNNNDPGAQLLNRVSKEKVRIISFLNASNKWDSSLEEFVRTVTLTMNTNGFESEVLNLTKEEWSQLHNYLKSIYTRS